MSILRAERVLWLWHLIRPRTSQTYNGLSLSLVSSPVELLGIHRRSSPGKSSPGPDVADKDLEA